MNTWERRSGRRQIVEVLDVEVKPAVDREVALTGGVGNGSHTVVALGGAFISTRILRMWCGGRLEGLDPSGIVSHDVTMRETTEGVNLAKNLCVALHRLQADLFN